MVKFQLFHYGELIPPTSPTREQGVNTEQVFECSMLLAMTEGDRDLKWGCCFSALSTLDSLQQGLQTATFCSMADGL